MKQLFGSVDGQPKLVILDEVRFRAMLCPGLAAVGVALWEGRQYDQHSAVRPAADDRAVPAMIDFIC